MTNKKGKIKEEFDILQLVPLSIDEVVTNEDLVKEILLRAPTKSLIRFKCVSKQWLHIISNTKFALDHFARSRSLTSGIYFNELNENDSTGLTHISLQGNWNFPTISFLDDIVKGSNTTLVHSSHGLILCRHTFPWLVRYSVCNFTTQKYALLPQHGNSYYQLLACLAFDPEKSPHYKVVIINQLIISSQGLYVVYIFSSETGSFKSVSVATSRGRALPHVALWDGAVHWMNEKKFHFRFEVDTNKLTETKMPPKPKIFGKDKIHYFGECGGHLLFIQYPFYAQRGFRVLQMKKGTCVWNVMFRVNMRPVVEEYIDYDMLGVVEESHGNGLALILSTSRRLISYNLMTKKVDVLADCSPEYRRCSSLRFQPFIESLFPVEFGPKGYFILS